MKSRKTLGLVLLVAGIVVLILSLLADPIGLGEAPGFGSNQIVGTIVGALLMMVGLILVGLIPTRNK